MNRFETMQESDQKIWANLNIWARNRAACALELIERDVWIPMESGKETEASQLYNDVHSYFTKSEEPLEDGRVGGSLARLCAALELDDFEICCLVFAMLTELDLHFEQLFLFLNNNWNERFMNMEWAIRLFLLSFGMEYEYYHYFLPGGTLLKYLLNLEEEIQGPGFRSQLKLKPTVIRYLLSAGFHMDTKYISWHCSQEEETSGGMEEEIKRRLLAVHKQQENLQMPVYIQIKGKGTKRRLQYAVWYASKRQQWVGLLNYKVIEAAGTAICQDEIFSEIAIHGDVLCIYDWEICVKERGLQAWSVFLEQAEKYTSVIMILSEEDAPELKVPFSSMLFTIEMGMPKKESQLRYWQDISSHYSVDNGVIEMAAKRYSFLREEIQEILERAQWFAGTEPGTEITDLILQKACRQQLSHNLDKWAVPVKVAYKWEDLILSVEQKDILIEAVNQMKYQQKVYNIWNFSQKFSYGTGLSILFSGPPGTGKTMAAQVLAGELGMELYRIQIPSVVSKYIGETEKNLKAVFREGERSQAILFFDEADALFSKRTEVKDSHDKYSNMEAAYMLQRMEEYSGIVILATNYPQNIDKAFMRRIRFIVEFYMPDESQRYLLWKQSFPESNPLSQDVDLEWLAEEFELSGSNIKNIVINAAFLAAPESDKISMCHIIQALKNEYRKNGKVLSEREIKINME